MPRGLIDLALHPFAQKSAPFRSTLYAVVDPRGHGCLYLVLAYDGQHAVTLLNADGFEDLTTFNTTIRRVQRNIPEAPGVVDTFDLANSGAR